MTRLYRNIDERLLANSIPAHTGHSINGEPSECWLWIGNVDDDGYGRITLYVSGRHRKVRAHRLSHEVFLGVKLTPEETLDHQCRVKECIHPNHTVAMGRAKNTKLMQQFWRNYRADQAGQTRMEIA